MTTIQTLSALEILDSRGRPTVQATCRLTDGAAGTVSVPSGASTGQAEALELRDGDPSRYHGLGCRRAVGYINQELHQALSGMTIRDQAHLDEVLCALDGTPNKSHLGANALLAVSLAYARAVAISRAQPLYHYFAELIGHTMTQLPRPTINLFSGGKHAGGQTAIQDVLVVPVQARTIDAALATTYAIYQSAAQLVLTQYGMRALKADEGGLAPVFPSVTVMIEDALRAITAAGYTPGADVALAVDVAASQFYDDGQYHLDGERLTSSAMIERVREWVQRYPILSVEDGLAEEDWAHWPGLMAALHDRARVMGDDLLCTNPLRIQQAQSLGAANALLLKVNQIGTVSEAAESLRLARAGGWTVTVSARSGETEDHWLADLAVGWGADMIKIGSITQSERLAKYNRLLAIEAELSLPLWDVTL
jgi:enolase